MLGIVADALNSFTMPDPSSSNELAAGLTFGFALALVAGLLLRFWLASRQIRHVARHRGELPAEFANTVSLSAHQKAADYTIAKTRLGLLELALGAGVFLGWTLLGGISTLNSFLLSALGGGGMVQQLAVLASFAVISALLDLPLGLYQTFSVEQAYGFNKTTPKLWLLDFVKSSLLGALIGLPIAALILWLMGAAGAQWWIWAWGTWVGFNLLLLWALPTFIAPLFNKFTALEDGTIKTQVTALMARCGFAAKGLFVMDGSKRSAHGNAYFTGFGSAKRVVFYDTLLAKLSPDEIAAVLAHELGHFKHRHLSRRMLLLFGTSLLAFAMLGWLTNQSWFYVGLGVAPNLGAPNDALALLLFMISAPLLSFFIAPVFSAMSRRDEFQADAYAVAHTSGQDLATALLKLYEDNAATLTPDPVYVRFYYSHPPASERLARLLGP